MFKDAQYIVVEGPIGAGKTSLATRMAGALESQTVFEHPEANPFLERFYQNMERWALPAQLAFLLQRVDQLTALAGKLAAGERVVSDFIFEKDPLFAALNLPGDQHELYRRMYESLQPEALPRPDLVIYLQARPETLIGRVHKRGMGAERRITEHYVGRVAERYARFFYDYDAAPLFVVDAEVLNPVDEDDDFALLLERLDNMRGFREFFNYAM